MKTLIAEATASARSQPVASILTVLIIASMILAVLMTAGRTVAAEQEVLASIDDVGTRTIQIYAQDTAGMNSDVLDRIANIDGIEWSAAFSSAVDGRNALIQDGALVPARYIYSDHLARLGIRENPELGATAYASDNALEQLGLIDTGGAITLTTGVTVSVGGDIAVPDYLSGFEPVVFIPASREDTQTINVVLVIAETPELVAPLADAVLSVLAVDDPTKVSVETSESLAQLRTLIKSQLGGSSRSLILALLAVMVLLVAIILYGLVMMRRKDFGRRRALGATRGHIVLLLVCQTTLLAAVGIGLGILLSTVISLLRHDPLPGIAFTLSLGVLAFAASIVAALAPAVAASRREPIRELRVP